MNTIEHLVNEPASNVADVIYTDVHDREKHLNVIQSIADELHRPMHEIAGMYEQILKDLRTQASIDDYLPVLVSKRVKEAYRHH
ncbi:DUF3562 domain-containing protein [Noviherbaspirillum sp.]|uniref:DUF3562 domain-containing protein n=1 Tax=Noviherbaspirillum sp. TaxID=1926288 RepID=UPI002FE3B64A